MGTAWFMVDSDDDYSRAFSDNAAPRWRWPRPGHSFDAITQEDTMVSSRANTVVGYLAELPPERRAVVRAVCELVRDTTCPTDTRSPWATG